MHCEQLESPKGMCRASASSDLVFSRTALQVAVQSSFFVKPLVVKYPMRKWMVQGPIKQNAYRLWMIMIDVNHSNILETPVLMSRFSSRLQSPRPGSMQLATHLHHPFHAVFCKTPSWRPKQIATPSAPDFWGEDSEDATDFLIKLSSKSSKRHLFCIVLLISFGRNWFSDFWLVCLSRLSGNQAEDESSIKVWLELILPYPVIPKLSRMLLNSISMCPGHSITKLQLESEW